MWNSLKNLWSKTVDTEKPVETNKIPLTKENLPAIGKKWSVGAGKAAGFAVVAFTLGFLANEIDGGTWTPILEFISQFLSGLVN